MATMKPCGVIALLKEAIKIISQNFKKLSLIAFIYFLLFFILFLSNIFSTKSVIYDLVFKIMNILPASPGTPQYADLLVGIKEDVGIFLGIELTFLLISFFITFLIRTAMIIISSSFYTGNSLSIKDIISRVAKTWVRPFVTAFYVLLLRLGYMTIFFLPFLIPSLALLDHHRITCLLILALLFLIIEAFDLYLSVVWTLGLVVSVLEESRGLEALGKARGLIEGMRLQGFVLNLIFTILIIIVSQIPRMLITKFVKSPVMIMVFSLIQLVFVCLLSVFEVAAYTVLYVQCKKKHGEEVKIQGSSEYRQLPVEEEIV